ncbi:MAG: TetR/AcrR family transcriptional regulator [Crocinitomicaceae bacterium]
MKKELNTEEKIKEAAKAVFLQKGFSGCTTREIAKASGMNVALVCYYFRSKDQLFQLIFQSVMEEFMHSLIQVFQEEMPLKEKMRILIEKRYEFVEKNPEFPNFIHNELNRNAYFTQQNKKIFDKIASTGIFEEALTTQQKGEMRQIDMFHVTMLIMSNCDFPFIARNFHMTMQEMTEEEVSRKLTEHRHVVTEMLMNYLFPN